MARSDRRFIFPPVLPEGYYWKRVEPTWKLMTDRDVSLGYFIRLFDVEHDKEVWRHVRHFRVAHFDTLEEGMMIMIAKHRMGGIDENERVVF